MADETLESGLPSEEPRDPQVPEVSEVVDDKPTSAPSGLTEDKLAELLDAGSRLSLNSLKNKRSQ